MTSRTMETEHEDMNNAKDDLGVSLPIKTMEDFLSFEEAIASSEDKRKALVSKSWK